MIKLLQLHYTASSNKTYIFRYLTLFNSVNSQDKHLLNEAEITIEPVDSVKSPVKKHGRHSSMDLAANGNTSITQLLEKCVSADSADDKVEPADEAEKTEEVKEVEKEGGC